MIQSFICVNTKHLLPGNRGMYGLERSSSDKAKNNHLHNKPLVFVWWREMHLNEETTNAVTQQQLPFNAC